MILRPAMRLVRATMLAIAAVAAAAPAVAAERDPVLEAAQAQCIQEGMLRGFSGEALKTYVSACAETKRNAPPRDLKPFAAEPGAC
jgi:hypothetical protein